MRSIFSLSNVSLAVLGAVALLVLSPVGHFLAIVAMVSFIGIPIFLILEAIPALFLLLAALRLGAEAWRSRAAGDKQKALAWALALTAMIGIFVVQPVFVNRWLDGRAKTLVAGDKDELGAMQPITMLAVLRNTRTYNDSANPCDDLCQRLLLTGAAKEVLELTASPALPEKNSKAKAQHTPPQWASLVPVDTMTGMAWRLEHRDTCPEPNGLRAVRPLSIPGPPLPASERFVRPVAPLELMRLKIAGGTCLIGETKLLSNADALVAHGDIHSGLSAYNAGFEVWADTVFAWRIAVWRRTDGRLVELYRRTGVTWARPPWLLLPVIINGYQFNTRNGWWRFSTWLHRTKYESKPPLVDVLTQRLGLDLVPRVKGAPTGNSGEVASQTLQLRSEQASAIDRILAAQRRPTDLENKLIADYHSGLGSARSRFTLGSGKNDASRVLRVVQDRRIDLPWQTTGAIRQVLRDDASDAAAFAAALVARLEALPPPTKENAARGVWNTQVRVITDALAQMPASILRPYQSQVLGVMRNPDQRMVSIQLLGHLDAFGPGIAPNVFVMMDEAVASRTATARHAVAYARHWTGIWREGARSICRLAQQSPDVVSGLRSRAHDLALKKVKIDEEIVAAAMLRGGSSKDAVRETLNVDLHDEKALRSFDFMIARAQRGRACD